LEAKFYKLSIFTCQNGGNIQDGVFFNLLCFSSNVISEYDEANNGSKVLIKKTRWRINSRWRVVLKFCSLQLLQFLTDF
jgi:hypothetical protein